MTLTPEGELTVTDNGPGMSTALIDRSLDYDIRVSDKTYYVSPSRGQLGNALKCLWAAPYALDPDDPGSVEVVSLGVDHRIRVTVDRIAQQPRLEHTQTEAPICRNGTSITLVAPKVACYESWDEIDDFYKSTQALVETYAAFNPHATFQLTCDERTLDYPATTPTWQKWLPSDKTSPFWYEPEHFTALIAAYLHRERGRTVKPKPSESLCPSSTASVPASSKRRCWRRLNYRGATCMIWCEDDELVDPSVQRLLEAMQAQARPVNPKKLGILGKAHLLAVLSQHHGVDPERCWYKKVVGEAAGLSCVLEVAFGVCLHMEPTSSGVSWPASTGPRPRRRASPLNR